MRRMITRDTEPDVFAHVEPIFLDAAFIRHLGITLEGAGRGWCGTSIGVGPDACVYQIRPDRADPDWRRGGCVV